MSTDTNIEPEVEQVWEYQVGRMCIGEQWKLIEEYQPPMSGVGFSGCDFKALLIREAQEVNRTQVLHPGHVIGVVAPICLREQKEYWRRVDNPFSTWVRNTRKDAQKGDTQNVTS